MKSVREDESSLNPLLRKLRTARRLGFERAARMVIGRATDLVLSKSVLIVASMTPAQLRLVEPVADGVDIALAAADPRQLLASGSIGEPLPPSFRQALATSGSNNRVHYATVDGQLAAWGFSVYPAGAWPLSETGTALPDRDDGTCFIEFETLPAYRGRKLHPALICHAAQERFAAGARIAYAWWEEDNAAAGKNILRVGFVPYETHRRTRVLRIGRPSIQPIA